jgi:glycerol-3-phosphate acyltransferase PlsY
VTQGILTLLGVYLLSAIPFGLLVVKAFSGRDVRSAGSGNIGATNVFRTSGKWPGIATLLLDAGKGALAVAAAGWVTKDPRWSAAAAFVAVLGHCYPVYLGFKGGKGIATGCGAYCVLAPLPMALTLGVFTAAVLLTRIVSIGSILAGLALPAFIWWLRPERALLISVGAAAALVILRHLENLRRLVRGSEKAIAPGGGAR